MEGQGRRIRVVPRYLRMQRESNYTFHVYRVTGRLDADVYCQACVNYRVPRLIPPLYPGPQAPAFAPVLEALPVPQNEPRHVAPYLERARARLRKRLEPYGLRWEKDLGRGGFGLASLFRLLEPGRTTPPRYYVAKIHHNEAPAYVDAFENEKYMTNTFKGAMHIVQTRRFPPYRQRVQRGSARLRARPDYVPPNYDQPADDKTGMMLLEYCPRGSLDKAIRAAVGKNKRFPTRCLWKLFQCLVQGCIAVAYDPGSSPELYEGQYPPYNERIAPNKAPDKTVHFDLDPQNVLVGDSTPGIGHSLFPVLKISDFGLTAYFQNPDLQNDENMYSLREYGKANFLTPEQFTGEWDYIPRNAGPATVQPPFAIPVVAGNWSWKHNLFQVGLIMACLLERCYPPVPPFAQRIAVPSRIQYPEYYADEPNHYPTRYGPGAATQLRQLEGNQGCPDGSDIRNIRDKVTALSYGEYLVDHDSNPAHDDYGHVVNRWGPRLAAGGVRGSPLPEGAMLAEESLLRELVAQCLCEKPFYRPSMAWLQAKIEEQIRKLYGKIDEDDEENEDNRKMREFVREIFDRPPPPSPPPVRGRRRKRNMKGKYPTEGQLARDRKEQKQKREEREAQRRVEEEVRDRQRQLDEEDEQDGAEDGEEN